MGISNQVYDCPHCGVKSMINLKKTLVANDEIVIDETGERYPFKYFYVIGQCQNCEMVLLFGLGEDENAEGSLKKMDLLYPEQKIVSDIIPQDIRDNYIEAKRIKRISQTAFSVMIRRCLEFMCIEKKAIGNNLVEKLEYLSVQGIIPRVLSEMTDVVRILGNIGAHATKSKIDSNDADEIEDYINAILEYVYIAPEKINRYKKLISSKKEL